MCRPICCFQLRRLLKRWKNNVACLHGRKRFLYFEIQSTFSTMFYSTHTVEDERYPTISSSQGEGLRALALLTGTCLTLTVARGMLSHNWWFFICLTWNLFLAWFPLGVLLVWRDLRASGLLGRGRLAFRLSGWGALALWLLFMPNAPYIITDLFHIRSVGPELVYFDTLTIFLGAATGLLAGLYSSLLAHRMLLALTPALLVQPLIVWAVVLGCQLLAGFGIYLGRFIRWNSWDLVTNPLLLSRSLWRAMQEPFAQKVTLTYGLPLAVLYIAFYLYATKKR